MRGMAHVSHETRVILKIRSAMSRPFPFKRSNRASSCDRVYEGGEDGHEHGLSSSVPWPTLVQYLAPGPALAIASIAG